MAETIVMVHGAMMGPWCWGKYRDFFESVGYCCITPTLRYHDMNPNDRPDSRLGTVSLLDYVYDIEEEIRKLDSPPILMGHSLGGLLVQILASRCYVKAAVLLTPNPPSGIWALKYSVLKSYSGVLIKWGFWKKPYRLSFKKSIYAFMHLMPPAEQSDVYNKMVYESGRAVSQVGFWFLDSTRASKVDPDKVRCPVLVISGKYDRLTTASVVKKVATKYKSVSTYISFENHAHWIIGEPDWQEISNCILLWLRKVVSERI